MGNLGPGAETDIPYATMRKLQLDPKKGQIIGQGFEKLLKERFSYLLDMIDDLDKDEKVITKHNKPIGNFPMFVAKKNEEGNKADIRISKGERYIEFTMDTNKLSQESLNIDITDHNYTGGYTEEVILESVQQSLEVLDKMEEQGEVSFDRCVNCD
ncbi:MAG: hypothetical protein PHE21_02860 [Candidatus Dojkabacteria bacterium]|nr:hypothetical protein [Candidatus Dojkabacteria bacterium]